jgi:hypothetical protein
VCVDVCVQHSVQDHATNTAQTDSDRLQPTPTDPQAYDTTPQGQQVASAYHLDQLPAILIIDPITGGLVVLYWAVGWVGCDHHHKHNPPANTTLATAATRLLPAPSHRLCGGGDPHRGAGPLYGRGAQRPAGQPAGAAGAAAHAFLCSLYAAPRLVFS